jgi:carbonic anhydrase
MSELNKLLDQNKQWAAERIKEDPEYFSRLAHLQTPEFLWVGCSDSRVAANVITGTQPGEIFVHRNIANMVVHTDLNLLSVLQYAVEYLKVKHVIVCGHYGCGGVQAAMSHQSLGIINKWLRNIKDVYRIHQKEVDALSTEQERFDRMVELNVQEQVFDLAKTSIIQQAWTDRGGPHLHGWVYRLSDGLIHTVCDMEAGTELDPIYRFDNLRSPKG